MKHAASPIFIVSLLLFGCDGREDIDSTQASQPKSSIKHAGYKADKIFEAIRDGDVDEVAELVERGADIDAKDDAGMTPLMLAISDGQRNMVRLLADAGASLEERDDQGMTALMIASSPGVDEMEIIGRLKNIEVGHTSQVRPAATVAVLLKAGADPNARDDSGATALMYAYDSKKVGLLIQHGALIDAVDENGRTALMRASLDCWSDKVEIMVSHGADRALRDKDGKTAADLVEESQAATIERVRILGSEVGMKSLEDITEQVVLNEWLECVEKASILSRIR